MEAEGGGEDAGNSLLFFAAKAVEEGAMVGAGAEGVEVLGVADEGGVVGVVVEGSASQWRLSIPARQARLR